MDKRTSRREYRDSFESAIENYRREVTPPLETHISNRDFHLWGDNNVKVCIRKRPIFSHEYSAGEFDVVTCFPIPDQKVVIHDARMHTDMKRMFINNHEFRFDRVFDDNTKNLDVYLEATAPLVRFAVDGGYASCMVYGQTGASDSLMEFYRLLRLIIFFCYGLTYCIYL